MNLLREIQSSATSSETKLADVLRKAKVLAARLQHRAFAQWVDNELNGYRRSEDVPDYRIFPVPSYGDFSGPFGSGLRNAPIPTDCIPERLRHVVRQLRCASGVSCYEQLLSKAAPSAPLRIPWDPNLTALVAQNIYEDMNCLSAWQSVSSGAIAAMLDTVRNRLLDFVLQIEVEAPDVGEATPGCQPLASERVNQIFHTYIVGGSNVVGGVTGHIEQVQITKGDLSSLGEHLAALGVDDNDIKQLKEAITKDGVCRDRDHFGSRVSTWLGTMVTKAASGAWNVSTKIAGDVLSKALCSYYGIN